MIEKSLMQHMREGASIWRVVSQINEKNGPVLDDVFRELARKEAGQDIRPDEGASAYAFEVCYAAVAIRGAMDLQMEMDTQPAVKREIAR